MSGDDRPQIPQLPTSPLSGARLWPFAKMELPEDVTRNPAKWAHERILQYIEKFEEGLDDQQEVAMRLVSHHFEPVIHIEDVSYHGPDFITFYGRTPDGERVQLIQHVTQLSLLLLAAKKINQEPHRIGFRAEDGVEGSTPGTPP